MFSALCVSEIGTIVLMYCEAKTAFEGADMVFEEVRVFIEVDGFQRKLSKTFASVGIGGRVRRYSTSTKFATSAIL